ncbi:Mitochondrial GTPase [Tulasnella sp. UAMH 9824]|nr:Mitochondrial GTPase [Tulasnella sp. UAMH 9824]
MATFTKRLPALLAQTHVVLEVRDVRLPLTSINPTLEAALQKWKKNREASGGGVCERIVVYSKRDLISGGEEALRNALSKHFDHRTHFNSNGYPKDLHDLQSTLVSIAKGNAEVAPTLNVLVVGMPNMGKSTLLNSLRWAGTNNQPAYLSLYPPSIPQAPTESIEEFLDILSYRLNARLRGNEPDIQRTAKWFLKWWREGGATQAPMTHGWGFDFDFRARKPQSPEEVDPERPIEFVVDENGREVLQQGTLEEKMEREVSRYVKEVLETGENTRGFGTSVTRERQIERAEKRKARDEKRQRKRPEPRR